MTLLTRAGTDFNLRSIQQAIKWTVYALLVVNFGFYIYEDVDRAIHTLHAGSTWFDWTSEFATTIDTLAWFVLLLMFELETYALDDQHWNDRVARTVRGVRLLCFVMIAHTVIAYTETVVNYTPTLPVIGVTDLCDLADDNISFVYNLEYTSVTSNSCADLSDQNAFFWLGQRNPLVSTEAGLQLARSLAWVDVIEVITWLVVILSIETVVRRQGKGIIGGTVTLTANITKWLGYLILFMLAIYWALLSHWLYTWDTFVWIAGFAAIDLNLSDWHDQMVDKRNEHRDAMSAPNTTSRTGR